MSSDPLPRDDDPIAIESSPDFDVGPIYGSKASSSTPPPPSIIKRPAANDEINVDIQIHCGETAQFTVDPDYEAWWDSPQ